MHNPYENILKHSADFRVKYKFRTPEEGGRKTGPPTQGIRCDFSLEKEESTKQYMIFPEFEDRDGNVITEKATVPQEGTARMWIVIPERRPEHYERIVIGTKCYFREGNMYSADCEVIEILDLRINPTV